MGINSGMPAIFSIFPILFVLVFVIVIGGILFNIGKGVSEWTSNNAQPEQAGEAEVVSKRTEVSGGKRSTATEYFITFELAGGVRKELEVSGREYGQVAEGDHGQLRHQGTRYLGFARQPRPVEPAVVAMNVPAGLKCDYCGNALPPGEIKCGGCGWTWQPQPAQVG
jgi:hypothetical protein